MNSGPVPHEITVTADGRSFEAVVRIDTPGGPGTTGTAASCSA
jgi:hypothetical protein